MAWATVAQRAALEARVAEQQRLLEFFQRQEAERVRAAASAAAAPAPPALSAPYLPPPLLPLQPPVLPPAVAVTGSAGDAAPFTQPQPAWATAPHATEQLLRSANAVPGVYTQNLPAVHQHYQQQQQQQPLLMHQAAPAGCSAPDGFGRVTSPVMQPAMQPQPQQHQPQPQPPLLLSYAGVHGGQPAHHGYSNSPDPGLSTQFPQQPAMSQAVIPGLTPLNGSQRTGVSPHGTAHHAMRQDGGNSPVPAVPAARPQPDPPSAEDGIRQLQALMAAMPQFAALAARLDKVGAHSVVHGITRINGAG